MLSDVFNTQWVFWARGVNIKQETFRKQINKKHRNTTIFKMHYTPPKKICECIKKGDKENFVINITRDVKDIAISKILYMKYDKPMRKLDRLKKLNDMRKDFGNKKLTDKQYINEFIKTHHFKHIIRNWKLFNNGYTHPNYLQITYEELSKRRLLVMKRICNFLDVFRHPKVLRKTIIKNNFATKAGRKKGDGINSSFRRKGIVGDWRNYLNKESLNIIEKLLKEF